MGYGRGSSGVFVKTSCFENCRFQKSSKSFTSYKMADKIIWNNALLRITRKTIKYKICLTASENC